MTARDTTRTDSENSDPTGRVPNGDAQTILDYLETVDYATLEGLAAKSGFPEAQLRDLLDDLQARGLVDVNTGFLTVHIERTDKNVATDGGLMRRAVDALSDEKLNVDLTPAEVFDVLSSGRRRQVVRLLATLRGGDGEGDPAYLDLDDLAALLARSDHGLRANEPVPQEMQHRTYVALYQTHCPALDEAGLIEYYDRPRRLRATDDAVQVARLMELVAERCQEEA
jgi:hypothetical protein